MGPAEETQIANAKCLPKWVHSIEKHLKKWKEEQ